MCQKNENNRKGYFYVYLVFDKFGEKKQKSQTTNKMFKNYDYLSFLFSTEQAIKG